MFTLSEFKLAKDKCPDEMRGLFASLRIDFPGWDRIISSPQEWDRKITQAVCAVMNSATISEGYARLLDDAGVPYRLGNPDEMLASVVAHASVVRRDSLGKFFRLIDDLISEANSNPEVRNFLGKSTMLRNTIRALEKYSGRENVSEVLAVLGKVHAVKSRI